MTKVVNPSDTELATTEQFGRIGDSLTALLRKKGLQKKPVQQVIEHQLKDLTAELAVLVQQRVDAMSEIIVRRVKVNRSRTPQEVIDAVTGFKQYVNQDVLATMPKGEGDEVDVWFVPTKRFVPVAEVPAFLAQYGLVPDPRAQAAVNEEDKAFADKYPNGSQWGKNSYLTFYLWGDERKVYCGQDVHDWHGGWWLCGVPAPSK